MSNFLPVFMRAAKEITRAKRSIALDADMNVIDRINVDDTVLSSESFNELLISSVQSALQQQKAVITNNMITDPSQAPQTNVHLKDLRMVVTIPVSGHGAIYLDQPIRDGVFERSMIDKLHNLAEEVIASGEADITDEDFLGRFESV